MISETSPGRAGPGGENTELAEAVPNGDLAVARRSSGKSLASKAIGVFGSILGHPAGTLAFALAALIVALSLTSPYFLKQANLESILEAVSIDGMIAAFSTVVMVMGGLDLSMVGVAVLVSVAAGVLLGHGVGILLVLVICLGIGLAFGLLNGGVVVGVGINPFVATLATWLIASGLAYVIVGGQSESISNPAFLDIAGKNVIGQLPILVVAMLFSYIVAGFLLRTTRYGLHLYAIGGGEAAAILSGVRVNRVKIITYLLTGMMGAIAGVFLASWSQAAVPTATGGNDVLLIFAAIILGGVSLTGGEGSALGTFLGVCFLGVVNNALVLWQISDYYQPVVTGFVLLLAVVAGALRQRRTAR